jgi:hypothetical protein
MADPFAGLIAAATSVCVACNITDESGNETNDWLMYAPWNRQLLCQECQDELTEFERERALYQSGFPGGIINPEDEESEEEGDPLNTASCEYEEVPNEGAYHILIYSDGTSSVVFAPASEESDEDVIDVTSDTDVESVDSITTVAR